MVETLSNYALAIICSSFLLNIIQMILPAGENKKYVIFVCSSIVTLIIVSPIISALNKEFDISDVIASNEKLYIEIDEQELEQYYKGEVINTYKENLKTDIIETLNGAGYEVLSIDCEYDQKTLEPNYLRVEIKSDDGTVQPVRIEVSAGVNSENGRFIEQSLEVSKIKSIVKNRYGIENTEVRIWKSY